MELKTKTMELVWSRDLDDFIGYHLDRPWSLGQNSDGLANNTLTSFEVYPDPEATALVEEWLASPPAKCPGRLEQPGFAESVNIYTETLLSELCNRGILPQGDLNVSVWW